MFEPKHLKCTVCLDRVNNGAIECQISGNESSNDGGGVFLGSGDIFTCEILYNTTYSGGGGVCSDYNSEIYNCLISGNIGSYAAGVYLEAKMQQSASHVMQFCTITGNIDSKPDIDTGGLVCSSFLLSDPSYNISNSIIWGNSGKNIYYSGASSDLSVTHCCIQGGFQGTGNIDQNPLFTLGPRGYYYLSDSAAGQNSSSPCINSGSDFSEFICFDSYPDSFCLDELTTRTDRITDINMVDMGYHYPTTPLNDVSVEIQMPAEHFTEGSPCSCSIVVTNDQEAALEEYPLFVDLIPFACFSRS
ncbi:right-handed parallel beta-helix repeat-containing protein [bacterium]|nr:right-handed parallel beta-helix repeat-containing protein [bacterium]